MKALSQFINKYGHLIGFSFGIIVGIVGIWGMTNHLPDHKFIERHNGIVLRVPYAGDFIAGMIIVLTYIVRRRK